MKIRWIGQGGYELGDGRTTILLDPYLSDMVEREEGLKRLVPALIAPKDMAADVLLYTHAHMDHLDTDTVRDITDENIVFAGPGSGLPLLEECGIPADRYISLNRGEERDFGDFHVKAVFADHTEDSVGYLIMHQGLTLYFTGDTLFTSDFQKHARELKDISIDVLFICINGRLGNMNVGEAVTLTQMLSPAAAVPNHYGMFAENTEDPALYTQGLKGSGLDVHILDYGKFYELPGDLPGDSNTPRRI